LLLLCSLITFKEKEARQATLQKAVVAGCDDTRCQIDKDNIFIPRGIKD
jgi:hypothetical protein